MGRAQPISLSLAVLGYVVMIVPILVAVVIAFTAGESLRFPPEGFSLRWFEAAIGYAPFIEGLVASLFLAAVSTTIALAIGVPVTLAIWRGRLPGRTVLEALFFSPFVLPELVIGLALFQQFVVQLHTGNVLALLIGHTAIMLPYAVRVTGASLALADPGLEEAARGLGAGPWKTFWSVTLPVLRPGIFSAAVLSFISSFNNVPLSLLLQSRSFRTLPITMLDYVQQNYTPIIAAMSVLLLLGTVVLAFVVERVVGFNRIFGGINR